MHGQPIIKLWKCCVSFNLSEVTSQILWRKRRTKKAPYMEDFVLCTSLTNWSTVFLERLIVTHLVATFLLFYGTRCMITVLTKDGQGPYVDPHDHSPKLLILSHVLCTTSFFYPDIQWPLFSHTRKTISFPFLKFPHQYPHSPSGLRQKVYLEKLFL
jgi:hypothetical protein